MNQPQLAVNPGNVKNDGQSDNFAQVPVINVQVETLPPFVHPKKFAQIIGLSEGVVGGWIDNGYIPTEKVGKYRMVNLVALNKELAGV